MEVIGMNTVRRVAFFAIGLFMFSGTGTGQTPVASSAPKSVSATSPSRPVAPPDLLELMRRIEQAEAAAAAARDSADAANARTKQLEREIESLKGRLLVAEGRSGRAGQSPTAPGVAATGQNDVQEPVNEDAPKPATLESLAERVEKLEEDSEVTKSRVEEQGQSRVETGEKFAVKLSGIVMFNAYYNSAGTFDALNGLWVLPPSNRTIENGSNFSATARQTQLNFAFRAPQIGKWRVSGDLSMDLNGGNAPVYNGKAFSSLRLRTARVRLETDRLAFVVGQDDPIISPLNPTSFAQLGFSGLSESGNLWNWVPQAKVAYKLKETENERWTIEGGILAPFGGPIPASQTFLVRPDNGERSRMPAFETRIAYTRGNLREANVAYGLPENPPFQIGVGVHYGRALANPGATINSVAVAGDIVVPLGSRFTLSGEGFWGRAISGLGGAIGQGFVTPGIGTRFIGIRTRGGWAQLQWRPRANLTFNAAFGIDDPSNEDLRGTTFTGGGSFTFNRTGTVNVIYRFRSNFITTFEYRRMETGITFGPSRHANHFNFGFGYVF